MDDLDLHLALEALRTNPAAHVYHERITRGMQAIEQGTLTPFERDALHRLIARFPVSTPPSPDPVAALIAAFQDKMPTYDPAAVATAIQQALAQRPATLNGAPVTITMNGDTHAHQANLAIGNQVGGNLVQVTIPIPIPDARFDALLASALRTHEQEKTLARIQHAAQQIESDRLLNLRLQGFVGRVNELAAIRERIAMMRPTGGYVLIKAAAGEGKSSSIAKLIQEAGITQTPHHFIALTTGREYQLGLLRAVVAQLILKHNLTVSYFPEESYPAMKGEFARILDELSKQGIAETIYLDGLDQLQPEIDGTRDLSFLPPQPPPGMVIVLGSRPDETLKPLEIVHRVDYDLPPLSEADALVLWRSVQPGVADGLLHDLYAALKGNALFVHLAAGTMRDQSIADAASLIKQIEQNPQNLFGITLERIKRLPLPKWDMVWGLFGLLLVAQEPLRLDVLGNLLGYNTDMMQQAVWLSEGLVHLAPDQQVDLCHLLFRDYLAASVFTDTTYWHQLFTEWCASDLDTIWFDDHDPIEQARRMYTRHHYITHWALSQEKTPNTQDSNSFVYSRNRNQGISAEEFIKLIHDLRQRDIAPQNSMATKRSCNVYLKDLHHILAPDAALFIAHTYSLCIQIGTYLPISWLDPAQDSFPPLPPNKEIHKLFVVISCPGTKATIKFDTPCQVLVLPQEGESAILEFPFLVQAAAQQSLVTIHFYYQWNVVQVIDLTLTTLTKPQKQLKKSLQLSHRASIRYTRTHGFTDLAMLPPQDLTIALCHHHNTYQLTIAWPDMDTDLSACIHVDFPIESAELNMVIGVVRKSLYEATWHPSYRTQVKGRLREQRDSLYTLAVAGNLLYTTLFAPERALPQAYQALTLLREWIELLMIRSASTLPKLQIIHYDIAIGIPWGLLYPDPVAEPSMVEYTKFWGCAFQLEVLTKTLALNLQHHYTPRSTPTIQSGVHTFRLVKDATIVDLTAQHRDALAQLARSHAATIDFYERATPTLLQTMIQHTDVLYMFCHGHTARPESDLVDWLRLLHDHLDQLPPEIQTRYNDLLTSSEQLSYSDPNQADSWLKWTDSLIPLRLLKQWLAGLTMQHQAIVILNMCESAQVLPSFDHGFIPFFSQVGARGIVGTECPIVAPFAAAFGEQLIESLLQGKRIGEILPRLRRKFIQEHRNPLGLAYTYYGDAELQIARKPDSTKETT